MSMLTLTRRIGSAFAITSLFLIAGITALPLTGCEKKAAGPAAPAVNKSDLVGTWRLSPGGELALAHMVFWNIEQAETRGKFRRDAAEKGIELLQAVFKEFPPTYTFRDDTTVVVKINSISTETRQPTRFSRTEVMYIIGEPEEYTGTYSIEGDQVVLSIGKDEQLRFDYTDGTLDRRHPDPKAPTFRLFKD